MADEFDNIIDDVAREMTSTPVDPNLARRVASRIDQAAPSRRAIWARPVLLAPLAVACALVVAVVISRNTHLDVERVPPPVVSRPAPTFNAAKRPGVESTAPVARASAAARQTVRPAPMTLPPLTLGSIDVEAMEVETMDVKTLDVPPIVSAERIEIDPIAIARIEIAPMP
jgi:hypothetical protein